MSAETKGLTKFTASKNSACRILGGFCCLRECDSLVLPLRLPRGGGDVEGESSSSFSNTFVLGLQLFHGIQLSFQRRRFDKMDAYMRISPLFAERNDTVLLALKKENVRTANIGKCIH